MCWRGQIRSSDDIFDCRFSILDWRNGMNKSFLNRFLDSFSDNRKSKTCPFDILRAGSESYRRIENLKWLGLSVIGFVLAVTGAVALAQQPAKVPPRIGFLVAGSPSGYSSRTEAFRQGLRQLGYVEGKTIAIEY